MADIVRPLLHQLFVAANEYGVDVAGLECAAAPARRRAGPFHALTPHAASRVTRLF